MLLSSAARAGLLLEGGGLGRRGDEHRTAATLVRRPRLHGREQSAGDLRPRHRRLHVRGREHGAAAADSPIPGQGLEAGRQWR